MCLLILALDVAPGHPVVLAANRDEFHLRPAAAADFWNDAPWVLAGRDLEGGGSWLGVTRSGRVAAVTNYREPGAAKTGAPSRGRLVSEYLITDASPADYLTRIHARGDELNGFNLVVGEGRDWWYCSNRGSPPQRLEPGVHGLSNHLLDTPWPKVERLKERISEICLDGRPVAVEPLLAALDDRRRAADSDLPTTGVGVDWERILSPPFIVTPDYGTRCSTVVLVDEGGRARFVEQSFAADGSPTGRQDLEFHIEVAS